ncbi:MAG: dTMP kinase [Candidatus Marinimicrobia bacterium]|jgi:dTMP kinase|nr:dTMP kinase [Candidatus Neomarinimicrobiota bacterium]MDP6401443.1 dTMP kinase [Candidatus Neomarinimicrobiota bacterium]MDP7272801.1 dTMP kinase [Candidatus Neomarinimicrobiota bacterium]MED5317144.1 dTMP kinase [Candidatus Neomarinimicrobiota bacterium]|tara:strand:+ start:1605 stop:2246 length:642 start_codon:yes stop_codon:yes gene_type:complete
MSTSNKPLFISFEGIDGCGKSTQVKILLERLDQAGIDSTLVREPGGTHISEEIREVLLTNRDDTMADRTETLLMTASRAQLTHDIIIPSQEKGKFVIADRFADSTLAYQGGGRGLNLDWLIKLNEFATFGVRPDLTFFIDVTAVVGARRRSTVHPDRLENVGHDFQEKVRNQYLKLVKLFPDRFITLDGMESPDVIHTRIWSEINKRMNKNEK